MLNPKISIILPNYNSQEYIIETLNSIIEQTYDNWEVILIDDKSNLETIKIIKDVLGDTATYFTFDIDGIDPTFAPGTGTPEVGGINVREAQLIIRHLNSLNFIGADVVEVSPPFDVNNMTSLVGATIAFEILCTMTKTN